jgi:hypothetical protein
MAKFDWKLKTAARISYDNGRIDVKIRNGTAVITTSSMNGIRKESLRDFAEGLRMIIGYSASIIGKTISLRGVKVDPDESATGAVLQIFPKDKRYFISFERNETTGAVKAIVPPFTFSDLPSAVQVAAVAAQAADLMKAYEREQ